MKIRFFSQFVAVTVTMLAICSQGLANTWSEVTSGTSNVLNGIDSYANSSTFISVGGSGTMLRSTDYGATWSSITSGTGNNINDISLFGTSDGYYVADNGTIRKTQDKGDTWADLNSQTNKQLRTVFAKGSDTLVAAGNDGYLTISYNGGSSFQSLASNTSDALNDIFFIGENGYIVGTNGRLLRTTNGGTTWFTANSSTSKSLNGIVFFDTDTGIAVGDDGIAVRSTNGGTTWATVATGTTEAIMDIYAIPNTQIAYSLLGNGKILKTTDEGATWFQQNTPVTSVLRAVSFSDASNGVAVGASGTKIVTGSGQPAGVVTVLAPSGGEYWVTGEQKSIQWNTTNIDSVSIYYSLDNGTNWNLIAHRKASDSQYQWTIPSAGTNEAKIRIESKIDATENEESGIFTIQTYKLMLTSPNGGETLNGGQFSDITWVSQNINEIHIDFSGDNGVVWQRLASNIDASTSTASVKIPLAGTSNALIRIIDQADANKNDISEAVFSVVGPEISITSPSLGTSWNAGENRQIVWNSQNVTWVKVDYTIDGGTTWTNIAPAVNASNAGMQWTIPNTPTMTAQIRLTDTVNKTIQDYSDVFTINRFPIAVTSPNGGEAIKGGSPTDITWNSSFIQAIDIDYSLDNGNTWLPVAQNVSANANTFRWTVPKVLTDSLRVRIRNSDDPMNMDISDAIASISGIRIISPLEGQVIIKEDNPLYLSINWESVEVDSVRVTMDSPSGITILADSIPSGNTVAATFTNIASESVSLKVMDISDTTQFSQVNISIGVPSATIVYPNGGEYFGQGRIERLQFTSTYTSAVDIKYHDGSNEFVIESQYDPSTGYYDWTVPNALTSEASLRIYHSNNGRLLDSSDTHFTITDENVTILTPNGGELFYPSERHLISWEANTATHIDIDYITRNGTRRDTYNIATRQLVATGGMNWTVPNTPGSEAMFIIKDSDKPGIYDSTDSWLRLAGIKLTSFETPGEKVLENSTKTINWIAVESGEIVIEYSVDNGTSWIQLADSYPSNVGFYNWEVPNTPTTTARVRIWQKDNSNVQSISESFEITGLALATPNGGEEWLIGTDRDITWSISNSDRIRLEYSIDEGMTWRIIVADVPGTPSTYSWDIPETATDQALVKISSVANPNLADTSNTVFSIIGNGVVITSPNGGESWANSSVQNITWTSRNIDSLGLAYTSDGGNNWIVLDTVASTPETYSWTLPTRSTLKYKVRAFDIMNPEIADSSDAFFTVTGSGFDVPVTWDYEAQTGESATVIIETDIYPQVAGDTIDIGDAVGFFFDKNGITTCGGYGIWTGSNIAITIWGDNSLTIAKDGFADDETIQVRVWDASVGREYYGTATWNGDDYYETNRVSRILSLTTNRNLNIPITANRWQLVSTNVVPTNDSIASMLDPVRTFLSFAKDQEGSFYYPAIDINNINIWNMEQAYMIYLWSNQTLTINGVPATVGDYVYQFDALKWYYVGYLPAIEMPIAEAFAPISSLIMVKDTDGQIYYPSEGINNISMVSPGKGYQLISSTDIESFRYPFSNDLVDAGIMPYEEDELTWRYKLAAEATGSSAVIILRSEDLDEGDEVGVMTEDGIICGRAKVNGGKIALTVWGDNPESADIDGALDNSPIKFRYYDQSAETEYSLNITSASYILSGESTDEIVYKNNAIIHANGERFLSSVSEVASLQAVVYPNPASESVMISAEGVTWNKAVITDMNGREILNTMDQNIDVRDLITGSYIVILYLDGEQTARGKFQIVR